MGIERTPEQLIKAGLTALKQKEYGRAISIFQGVRQDKTVALSYRLKAQMGLIRTYEAQGDIDNAKQLCQSLLKSRSQSIRHWGQQTIKRLSIGNPVAAVEQDHKQGDAPPATSGFVPLDEVEPLSTPSANARLAGGETASREAELQSLAFDATVVPEETAPPPSIDLPMSGIAAQPTDVAEDAESSTDVGSSLFHYQTLNEQPLSETSGGPSQQLGNGPLLSETNEGPSQQLGKAAEQQQPPMERQRASVRTERGPDSWPVGERLSQLRPLGNVSMGRLWLVQIFTFGLFFWVTRALVQLMLWLMRSYLQFLEQILPFPIRLSPVLWEPHTWTVVWALVALTLAVPWLWPLYFRSGTRLSRSQLQEVSPEADQLLQRFCAKRRWQRPAVDLIPTDIPLIFSYGWRPRYGRLVLSQGLLDCLAPDELAALMMYEVSHWSHWDWVFFSTHGFLLQGLHRAYWFLARWGEPRPIIPRIAAGILATLSYGVFWLLVKVGVCLSRIRVPYRDRAATEMTGNPNGLIRGMAKVSTEMAQAIVTQGYTPPLLESLELMLPVAPASVNSVENLAWGILNPLRHWLAIPYGHPPLGDRLYTLGAYVRHWHLKPSLNFSRFRAAYGRHPLSSQDWYTLILWSGLWSGLFLGLGLALILWLAGALSGALNIEFFGWLYRDRSVLLSMPLIVAATVQLLRINPFFPEIANSLSTQEAQLRNWQKDMKLTPLSSFPLKIGGTLTGRPALANWLGQEWRIHHAATGDSIRLHYISYGGPLSNLFGPASWLRQSLHVTGWFRRGHRPWIDIDQISGDNHATYAHYPIWSVIFGIVPLCYGIFLLVRGG